MLTAEKIKAALDLKPLPGEGGYFAETYRSPLSVLDAPCGEGPNGPGGRATGAGPALRDTGAGPARRDTGASPGAEGAGGRRPFATAIYYLLTPDTFSAMHRLRYDEVYHLYLGGPVQMLHLGPGDSVRTVTLGSDILAGMRPQVLVPAGAWQGSRLQPGAQFALMGTTMAPGFDPADYEHGSRKELIGAFPEARDLILLLTRG